LPIFVYRGADKSLAQPDRVEVIAVAETWLDGQHSELFLSG